MFCDWCEHCLARKINDMRKTTFADNEHQPILLKMIHSPDPAFHSIKRNAERPELSSKHGHESVIVWCVVKRGPANLKIWMSITFVDDNISRTFEVILMRLRTWRKAWARCSPVWRPGQRWNPIKSDRSFRMCWGPWGVWTVVVSIQWAVTAIKGVRFVSDHISIVVEIFPREFCNPYQWKNIFKTKTIFKPSFPSLGYQGVPPKPQWSEREWLSGGVYQSHGDLLEAWERFGGVADFRLHSETRLISVRKHIQWAQNLLGHLL